MSNKFWSRQAAEKMREHYGLEIPACVIQKITEEHARKIADLKCPKTIASAKLLIAEMDGGMVLIVKIEE